MPAAEFDATADGLRPNHCVAVRVQLKYYDWEESLYLEAKIKHSRAAWWWGQKVGGPKVTAVCWICEAKLAKWSRNYPMPYGAKSAVEDHKFTHRADQLRLTR